MKNSVRELRSERGWSQGDLADQLEVSRQTVNAIETGKYDPSLPLAFAIAKLFGKSIEKNLFNGEMTMKSTLMAGFALALSLAAPVFSKSAAFDVGALQVQQVSTKGTPVILIPSLASGAWVWEDTAKRLEGTHAVYLLTLPGFDGRAPVAGTTLDSLTADIVKLIAMKKLDHPVLVGHSLGGTLSLKFATEHSDLIKGVVAVDGLPVFPGTENITDRKPMGDRMRSQFGGQTKEQFAASQMGYMKQIGVIDPALAEKLAVNTGRSDAGAAGEFAAQVIELDLRPRLVDIKLPVVEISPAYAADLALMGLDEDRKTDYYRLLLTGVADLDVVSISPARHFVMFDQPEKFAAALDAALTKFSGKSK